MKKKLCPRCAFYRTEKVPAGYRYDSPRGYGYYPEIISQLCQKKLTAVRTFKAKCKFFISDQQINLKGVNVKVSVFDEINKITDQQLSSDLPDEIIATITKVEKTVKTGQYAGAPQLKVTLKLDDGSITSTIYRIPKSWTGKGQLDMLKKQLAALGLKLAQMEGKTFHWKRIELTGSVKGNARHYPVRRFEEK